MKDPRRTSTILTDLRGRLVDLCHEHSRGDLADAVYLLDELARLNLDAARSERRKMLAILASDDNLLAMAAHLEFVFRVLAEREPGMALH